eukprot:TRINITY_DN11265_c0_g1_i1.p1 TRINITY_DN11265_c0_g1~~TRINITY_DN11265_c0_g1_i1.p1  ORF type:complete len:314 (-),score=79.68 TRINITY_DN11265_c0_g1_i1:64-1005(-)
MGNSPSTYLSQIKYVDLKGKVAIVTGANTGIGYITAREIAKMGAHVILACRDQARGDDALNKLKKEASESPAPGLNVEEVSAEVMLLDLASLESVRSFTADFKAKQLPLHILVNNAGVMALPERKETKDGFEMQWGTNHLGHFLLTTELLDILKKSGKARIVNVSSEAHKGAKGLNFDDLQLKNDYSPWGAYSASKLSNILFTKELQRRLDEEESDIVTYAVHPGFVQTELTRYMDGVVGAVAGLAANVIAKTVENGSLTSIKTATDPAVADVKAKYWSDCEVAQPTQYAEDMEAAKKLWEVSVNLLSKKQEE